MKTYSIIILWVLPCCFFAQQAVAQIKVSKDYFVKLFEQGKYEQAFTDAYTLRKQKEYGKSAFISYVMAKALCLKGDIKNSEKGFKYILSEYEMDIKQQKFMQDEMMSCSKPEPIRKSVDKSMFVNFILNKQFVPRAGSMGKMGYTINCVSEPDAFKLDTAFNDSQAEKRIFNLNESKAASEYYGNFLGKDYKIFPSGNFMLITKNANNLSTKAATEIAAKLDNGISFFHNTFDIRKPDKIIAVFLMNDKVALQQMAKKLHGITLSNSNIGYSNLSDLTLLGISDQSSTGTLFHELFHLTVRADIGDIPGWLDEGIACLYETSHWQGQKLFGDVINWRTMVIKEYLKTGKALPELSQLLKENWQGFFFNETNTACDVSLNYAVAKHFAIYLQEKNLLKDCLLTFKNRVNVFTDTNKVNQSTTDMIEKVTSKSMEDLQQDFSIWMKNTYKIPLRFDVDLAKRKIYALREYIYQFKNDDPEKAKLLEKRSNEMQELLRAFNNTNIPDKATSTILTKYINEAEFALKKYMHKTTPSINNMPNNGP